MEIALLPPLIDQIIRETSSQGWCFLPRLLSDQDLTLINQFIDQHKGDFVAAKVGKGSNQARREEIRGDYTLWLDPLSPPEPFRPAVQFLDQLLVALNRELFLGVKEFETHLAYYPPGTFYKTHLDKHEQNSSRAFSFVFYLNQEWSEENGGELVIYNKENKALTTVFPKPGSMICFLSEDFPHEVKAAKCERRSLTGWMHTKIIN